jgi:hypothetical protein
MRPVDGGKPDSKKPTMTKLLGSLQRGTDVGAPKVECGSCSIWENVSGFAWLHRGARLSIGSPLITTTPTAA